MSSLYTKLHSLDNGIGNSRKVNGETTAPMTPKPIDTEKDKQVSMRKVCEQLENIYNTTKPWNARNELRAYLDKIYVALEKES